MHCVLTGVNVGFHSELVAASLNAAVECWDVLLLSERIGLSKHRLYLTNVALLKLPETGTNRTDTDKFLTEKTSDLHTQRKEKDYLCGDNIQYVIQSA